MHPVACSLVDTYLTKGAKCSDGSMMMIPRSFLPGVQFVACCDDVVPTGNILLNSVQDVGRAANPRHSLAIRYHSQIPRLITMVGGAVNGQIEFIDDHSSTHAPTFGKECCTDKLLASDHHCAEICISIRVSQPKSLLEIVQGQILALKKTKKTFKPEGPAFKYELTLAP